jgi:signal transduction histidine kinase
MKKSIIQNLKEKSKQYGVPIWKLPDVLILMMAFINIVGMFSTYYLALNFVADPRTAVLFVAVESAVILIIGNIIAESSRKIISSYRLKEEFIDLVSHQIRTPITNVKWNLELLKDENLNKKQAKYTNRLVESVEKITSLVNDFVYLSRLDQSKKELILKKTDMKKVVDEILKELEIFASSKNIKFELVDDTENIFSKTDQKKIRIIISNVIENALKYSYENSKIKIKLYNSKNSLLIKTKDTGCGIDVISRPYIFDKFYRATDAKKLSADGTGVGLYISKILLKELGGEIWFESNKGKGSAFYISLPLFK